MRLSQIEGETLLKGIELKVLTMSLGELQQLKLSAKELAKGKSPSGISREVDDQIYQLLMKQMAERQRQQSQRYLSDDERLTLTLWRRAITSHRP